MSDKVLGTRAASALGKAIVQAATDAGMTVRQGVRQTAEAIPQPEAVHLGR